MGNAAGTKDEYRRAKGSEQGLAGVRLQNALPRARVVYESATGATKPENLSYASRLGLWGPGTAFANRDSFLAAMTDGGIAAMEIVARDLKRSEEHQSELQLLMRLSYAVFCLTKKSKPKLSAY